MSKAPLKVKRDKHNGDNVSYDARMTKDCTGFCLRVEGGKPAAWVDYLMRVFEWSHEEIKALQMKPDEKSH